MNGIDLLRILPKHLLKKALNNKIKYLSVEKSASLLYIQKRTTTMAKIWCA